MVQRAVFLPIARRVGFFLGGSPAVELASSSFCFKNEKEGNKVKWPSTPREAQSPGAKPLWNWTRDCRKSDNRKRVQAANIMTQMKQKCRIRVPWGETTGYVYDVGDGEPRCEWMQRWLSPFSLRAGWGTCFLVPTVPFLPVCVFFWGADILAGPSSDSVSPRIASQSRGTCSCKYTDPRQTPGGEGKRAIEGEEKKKKSTWRELSPSKPIPHLLWKSCSCQQPSSPPQMKHTTLL